MKPILFIFESRLKPLRRVSALLAVFGVTLLISLIGGRSGHAINMPPSGGSDPLSIHVDPSMLCNSGSATVSLSNCEVSVQWQASLDDVYFWDIQGENQTTLNAGPITQTTWFRAKFPNGFMPPQYTTGVVVTVSSGLPTVTPPPSPSVWATGNATFSVTSTNTQTYQWYKNGTEVPQDPSKYTVNISNSDRPLRAAQ